MLKRCLEAGALVMMRLERGRAGTPMSKGLLRSMMQVDDLQLEGLADEWSGDLDEMK